MPIEPRTELCRYHYDPLDRLVGSTPSTRATLHRYYLQDRLVTETQGLNQRTIFQFNDQLLAHQQRQAAVIQTSLLVTDLQRSILHTIDSPKRSYTYPPYGHRSMEDDSDTVLQFNGERRDSLTGHYLLGNGYRAYNPFLMRFNSPDRLSPFGKGGLNHYAYCLGDPVNHSDPTGQFMVALLAALSTKATALLGGGLSITAGFMADALGMSRGWVYTAAASATTSAVVAGVALGPSSLALQQTIRPLAQAAFVTGSIVAGITVAARFITPVARNFVNRVVQVSQQLRHAAMQSYIPDRLLRTPLMRRVVAHRGGFDLPRPVPTRPAANIRH